MSPPADPVSLQYEELAFAVPPNSPGAPQEVSVAATFFYVLNASTPNFRIVLNDTIKPAGDMQKGFDFGPGAKIFRVQLINLDPTIPLTALVCVGTGRPLDNSFKVYSNLTTPTIRDQIPNTLSLLSFQVGVAGVALDTWASLLPYDDNRAEVWLWTNATKAYYTAEAMGTETSDASRDIANTCDLTGFVKLKNKTALRFRIPTDTGANGAALLLVHIHKYS